MLIFIIPSIVIAGFSLRGIYVANNDLAHYRKIEKNILADISGGNDVLSRNQRIRRIMIKQIQS